MKQKAWLEQMDNRTLYLNLALTQVILFAVGVILYFIFLHPHLPINHLLHHLNLASSLMSGIGLAALVLTVDLALMRWLPSRYFDDGGVNERLFRDLNIWQIFILALVVALVEEWLFRAVLQNIIGLFWASLIFALIHVRYFTGWLYGMLVISISFGFGAVYSWTGSFWSVVTAHFLIDFCLGLLLRYRLIPNRED